MKEVNCRLCMSDQYKVITHKASSAIVYPIVRCKSCGLYYTRIQPSDHEFESVYEGFDHGHEKQWDEFQDRFNSRVLWLVRKRLNSSGKLLDLGAGAGKFLKSAQAAGFEVTGVEPIAGACKAAKQKYGIDLINSTLEAYLKSNRQRYDVITLLNVFEHLADPLEVLRLVYEHLNRDGLCVVVVPNTNLTLALGLARKVLLRPDPYLLYAKKLSQQAFNPPYHLTAFTPRSLRNMASKVGFEVALMQNAPVIETEIALKNMLKHFVTNVANVIHALSFKKLLVSHSLLCILRK
jgi:2-polyprenyl-3-methyl-5-hydroxy-6-metoxy-1,4-benzoquinol methylase